MCLVDDVVQLIKIELESFLSLPSHFEELSNKGVKQIASGNSHVLALLGNSIEFLLMIAPFRSTD